MGKVVLITGANRGLGRIAAQLLEQSGHTILMTARDSEKGLASMEDLQSAEFFQMDVTRPESIQTCFEGVRAWLKSNNRKLDVLINNAASMFDDVSGSVDPQMDPLYSSMEVLESTFTLNTFAPYEVIKVFLPLMNRYARSDIINVSSGMGALTGMGTGAPAYRMSKCALNALTAYLAASLAGTKIRVNSLCPGWVKTELGGEGAPRTPEEGLQGLLWIVNEMPDLNGKFIRDRSLIEF